MYGIVHTDDFFPVFKLINLKSEMKILANEFMVTF